MKEVVTIHSWIFLRNLSSLQHFITLQTSLIITAYPLDIRVVLIVFLNWNS